VPAAVFGGGLLLVGILMMRSHRATWAGQQVDPGLNQWDRQRLRSRYRRRMQMSGMICVMGVMLGVGDAMIWQQDPAWIAVYWIVVICLGAWLLLLGMGDLTSVRMDAKQALTELRQIGSQRKELEAELEEIRRQGSNGKAGSNGRR